METNWWNEVHEEAGWFNEVLKEETTVHADGTKSNYLLLRTVRKEVENATMERSYSGQCQICGTRTGLHGFSFTKKER